MPKLCVWIYIYNFLNSEWQSTCAPGLKLLPLTSWSISWPTCLLISAVYQPWCDLNSLWLKFTHGCYLKVIETFFFYINVDPVYGWWSCVNVDLLSMFQSSSLSPSSRLLLIIHITLLWCGYQVTASGKCDKKWTYKEPISFGEW